MGLLYVQAVCVQKEIIYADYQDALLSIPGSRSILDHNDLLERIINPPQRVGFLLQFGFVRDRECRLNEVSHGALVANKIHFQLFTHQFAITVFSGNHNESNIDIEIS